MRRCTAVGVALLAALSFPDQASAQEVFFGGGATLPTGDYKRSGHGDEARVGVMTVGGLSFPVSDVGLSIVGEGFFGRNDHEYKGDSTDLYGAMGGVLYDLGQEDEPGVYLLGQIGLMVHKFKSDDFPEFEESNPGLAFGGGAGFSFPLAGLGAWIEGRYMQGRFDAGNTTFLGGMAGVSIPLG